MIKKPSSHILLLSFVLTFLLTFSFAAGAAEADSPGEKAQFTSFSSTATGITLSWKENDEAVGYKLYEIKDGKGSLVKKTADCSARLTELTPDTEYLFRVRAYTKDADGNTVNGILSDVLTVRTKLGDIGNLHFIAASDSAIKVGWNKVKNAGYYKVAVAPFGQSTYKTVGTTTNDSFTVKELVGKTGYKIRVVAVSDKNTSVYTRIPLHTKPTAVKSVKAAAAEYESITVKWDKMPYATQYSVYVCETKDGKYKLKGTTAKTSFKASFDRPGTQYYFKIRAAVRNEYQNTTGSFSDVFSASTKAYPLTINLKSKNIRKGEYLYLNAVHYKNVQWTSSDTKVVFIKGARAYAASTGSATITAKSGNRKTSVKVTVGAPVVNYVSCVYDYTKDQLVFSNKYTSRCRPASITKLITALVALEYMNVNDIITVGNELKLVAFDSTCCGIRKGEKFRFGDLLYGMILPSGGDAAYSISVSCARKAAKKPNMGDEEAIQYFVSLMNSYMKALGATGTHFVNPDGYPAADHYSTVHDIVLAAKQVLKNPTLKKVTSASSKYVKAIIGKSRTWKTTNQLLNRSSRYYSPYANGMKTGTVSNTNTTIVSSATKKGRTIITVMVGCESFNARYTATHKLYNAYL